jgi:hypothetical protein
VQAKTQAKEISGTFISTCADLLQQCGIEKVQVSLQGLRIEVEPGKISRFSPEKHLPLVNMTEYTDTLLLSEKCIRELWLSKKCSGFGVGVKETNMCFEKPPKVLLKKSVISGLCKESFLI